MAEGGSVLAQTDIDKILQEIKNKKRQRDSQNTPTAPLAEKAKGDAESRKKPADSTKNRENGGEKPEISHSDKEKISRFLNSESHREQEDYSLDIQEDFAPKKSEDYIDENFKKFFTQSIVVTKPPEETSVKVKRKKGLFFKKKYITDSLSLNTAELEIEPEEKPDKKRRKKDKKKNSSDYSHMPIVKTASDVRQEDLIPDVPQQTQEPADTRHRTAQQEETVQKDSSLRSKKLEQILQNDAVKEVFREKAAKDKAILERQLKKERERRIERERRQKERRLEAEKAKELSRREKPQENSAHSRQNSQISPRNGKEKKKADAEALAQSILARHRAAAAVAVKEREERPIPAHSEPAPRPVEENTLVSSIYTSIIESRAKQDLQNDITAYIPQTDTSHSRQFEPEEQTQKAAELPADLDEEEEEEEVFRQYISKSEFFSKADGESRDIVQELADFRRTLSLRIILGFVCGLILTYFNMAASSDLPMPAFIHPAAQPLMFYIACGVVYLIALVGFLPTVISGFKSLSGAPAPDTMISLGAVLAAVQMILLAFSSEKISRGTTTIFAAFVCICLAFNAMGKRIATTTIIKNLSLANAPDGINAGSILKDSDRVRKLSRTLEEKLPRILISRKTGSITNFVAAGFSIHQSDYTAKKAAIFSYIVTAVCFIWSLVISKSFTTALFCAAGAAALQMPLSSTLVNSVPSALMQKNLEKVGAMVNGWQGIDQLSKTTHVNLDARHLFPSGTVILHGIKTFEKERLDLAIIYAASVLIKKCDVLKPVFMEVIEGKTDILYPLEECEYTPRQGYVAWVNNNRVIIGNRNLMESHDISMPPISLETKFISQGRKPIYLAVGGKLFGMFVVSYQPDKNVKNQLFKLIDKGVSIILTSSDFNIDPHLVQQIYDVPADGVIVLNQKETALLSRFTRYTPACEACVAHLDSLYSLVAGFCGAESAKSSESVCSIIQVLSVAIGAILSLIFTYSQTISALPITSLILLAFGWMGLTMLAAFAKKY